MNTASTGSDDTVIVPCPRCQQRLRLPQHQRPLGVTCTACRHRFDYPSGSEVSDQRTTLMIAAGVGGIVLLVIILSCAGAWFQMPQSAEQQRQHRVKLVANLLNQNRQSVLQSLHPVGTAKRIEVHDADVVAGPVGERLLRVRYTLYWQGPVTTDGYTTVLHHFDLDSQRPRSTEIIATNGLTNAEATGMSLDFLGSLLQELARQP